MSEHYKTISWVILIGSITFLIAAFGPYYRVFGPDTPDKKLEVIHSMRSIWNIGQVLFGGGALVTAAGLTLLAFSLKNFQGISGAKIGSILMLIGAMLWMWHCVERIASPEEFVYGNLTPFLFVTYSILTQVGMVLTGLMMLNLDLSAWVGWMFIVAGSGFFVLMVIFKDMPPFVYYLVTGVLSVVLLRYKPGTH